MRILSVFGTRPEAIKMAPLVQTLAADPDIEARVAVTAQHREMLDQVLDIFGIKPDYDLNLMKHGQNLADITSGALNGMLEIIKAAQPDLLLVHGDTTTTFAGALAAFYAKIPCGHVEAGLRTYNKYAPFPEEMNRQLTACLADYHFAPTATAKANLLAQNIPAEKIVITGNTVIDALLATVAKCGSLAGLALDDVDWQRPVILLTCHRRENWGQPMTEIFNAIRQIVLDFPEVQVIFPVHKNPLVQEKARAILGNLKNVFLIEPVDYAAMATLMNRSYLVLTDSGGLQEEAPALGKPVLVLREVTERPEAIAAGTARLAGISQGSVYAATKKLLTDKADYAKMAQAINPYGDGHASERILAAIKAWQKGEPPENWQP